MKRVTKAVMLWKTLEVVKLNTLAIRVKEAMQENAVLFPGTETAVTTLADDQELFGTLIGTAKGNHQITTQRNEQAVKVYGDLQRLMTAVNTVAKGDITIINLSGFYTSADPSPLPIPDKVVIKRIDQGDTALSAKIHILSVNQRRLWYTVRISTLPGAEANDPSWTVVLHTTSSKRLVLTNLVRHQDIFVSICASNSTGTGLYSEPMSFSAS